AQGRVLAHPVRNSRRERTGHPRGAASADKRTRFVRESNIKLFEKISLPIGVGEGILPSQSDRPSPPTSQGTTARTAVTGEGFPHFFPALPSQTSDHGVLTPGAPGTERLIKPEIAIEPGVESC